MTKMSMYDNKIISEPAIQTLVTWM